ncbi:hypothetical protein K502DRAFT_349126 [Neoconidiobolus thromboides FSU 785]|nr:hypothetical protein K502DRAFT_349126 [Neoconidiobolus thromboides FSU 785]
MDTVPKIKPRSKMNKRHHRVDALERNIMKTIACLQQLKTVSPSHLSVYHTWCVEILIGLQQETLSVVEDYDYIELLIVTYKQELNFLNNNDNFSHIIEPITLSKQPTTGYGTFLQNGTTIYLKYIDLYKMWYTCEEVNALLINSKPGMPSYAFLALLAYFTGSNNSTLTQWIYKNNLKKAKEGLAEVYANPSFNGVISLLFLCFISVYIPDPVGSARYFSSAVRMAQALGYDKIVEEMEESDKKRLRHDKEKQEANKIESEKRGRIVKLWNSLSLVYYSFLTMFPNMLSLGANFKPMGIELPDVNNNSQMHKTYELNSLEMDTIFLSKNNEKVYIEKTVTESLTEVVSHIQKVKLSYSRLNKIHEISDCELQLPKEKFNTVLTSLTSQLMYNPSLFETVKKMELKKQIESKKTIQHYYESNIFNYHLNAYTHLVLIYLYYPSVLVFPKPKRFPINEALILYKSAQFVAEFFLTIKQNNIQQKNKSQTTSKSNYNELAINNEFHFNYKAPYYTSTMYVVYVYLSFISEERWLLSQGFGKKLIVEAKAYVLKLLKMLKATCDSKLKSERLDSKSTIQFVKENLRNFEIEDTLLLSINEIIS